MSKLCYTPIKGLDDVIANRLGDETDKTIANLRSLID